ncbi:MAG TPA: tetratricopeptide repeat protein, partial [Gemmatimonadaceae bacterium]
MRSRAAATAALLLLATVSVSAQQKEPKRPKLNAQADTNDAHAYYAFALQRLKDDPEKAADALYWSTRLEPSWADAYYARRVALLLIDRSMLSRYWGGDRRTVESKEVKRIDSLFYQSLTINPFVSQTLERQLFEAIADEIAGRYERAGAGSSTEVRYAIDQATRTWGPAFRAWLAYGEGRYADALALYAQAIKEDKRNGPLHADRGRIFLNMNQPDSALAEMT